MFGGFDNNNNNKGTMYHQAFEKLYNAYLLIYDRKSSTLSQTDVNAFTLYPKSCHIMRFNTSLLHDKQIFSDEYRDLMLKLCELDPVSTCKRSQHLYLKFSFTRRIAVTPKNFMCLERNNVCF